MTQKTTYKTDQQLIKRVTTLRDSSVTYKVIAEVLGVSQSTVWRIASSN